MYIIFSESLEQSEFAVLLLQTFGQKWKKDFPKRTEPFYPYIDRMGIWFWSGIEKGQTFEQFDDRIHKNGYNSNETLIRIDDIPKIFGPKIIEKEVLRLKDLKLGQKFKWANSGIFEWIYIGEYNDKILIQDPTNNVITDTLKKEIEEVILL